MMLMYSTKDVPARSNLYNMARIFQAYAFMILTDEYGEIPYTEAGAGYTDHDILSRNMIHSRIFIQRSSRTTEANCGIERCRHY